MNIISKILLSILLASPVAFVIYAVIYVNSLALEPTFTLLLAIAGVFVTVFSAIKVGDIWATTKPNSGINPSVKEEERNNEKQNRMGFYYTRFISYLYRITVCGWRYIHCAK